MYTKSAAGLVKPTPPPKNYEQFKVDYHVKSHRAAL